LTTIVFSRPCRVGACAVRTPWHPRRRTSLAGPLHNKLALLLALVSRNYIRKSLTISRDGRI
jgi:hypothetical protein